MDRIQDRHFFDLHGEPTLVENLAFTDTSAASAALPKDTELWIVPVGAACWIVMGADPTAAIATGIYVGEGERLPIRTNRKVVKKIAAIRAADTSGTLCIYKTVGNAGA